MVDDAVNGAILGLCVSVAYGAWRAASCNFRYWLHTRRMPLVLAPREEISPKPVRWRWREQKWPDPGVPGAWRMSDSHCLAYARLAERRARRHELISGVLSVVIGALLGVGVSQLGPAWNGYAEHVSASGAASDSGMRDMQHQIEALTSSDFRPFWLFVVGVVLVVFWPQLQRSNSERAQEYAIAARRQRAEKTGGSRSAHRPHRPPLWDALFRRRRAGPHGEALVAAGDGRDASHGT